ncbi:PREDICTED: sorting nexin-8-like [Nicrophorus vespilloides]|uniref:Sorting nexin-8-like n=1 Tax=Nicrophorus vespilloides TaxID=110193 RepID=A0ABM1N161_NICVS|nr:PREDICTED: sorting nexin-8-like [Nicrophorus vespilloides]XP_017780481.1 PREDICTED: sorting nexin-8-like [Nicrophorus vespilloides]XP_017780561.1 PREDICTED: sorting nexin-8-like [Nicrophorus vespilloides]
MATELTEGLIPAVYRDIFEVCSHNGSPIHKEVYQVLLNQCKLDAALLKTIWNLAGPPQGEVTRTSLYKTLALVAWTQQGKSPTDKLFQNFNGNEYPLPQLGDLNPVRNLKLQINLKDNPATLGLTYGEIMQLDSICVELVPEKKGLFLKHSEYVITSRRFNSKATRRYNDFVALYELLLARFPYRIVPRLPPKKIVSDSHFLEARRRGLHRWMTLVCRHPTISRDQLVAYFLTDQGPDFQYRIRDIYRRAPDEFMTSDFAANSKHLIPNECTEFAANREQVRTLVQIIGKLKYLADAEVERAQCRAKDAEDLAAQLKALGSINIGNVATGSWTGMQKGFVTISGELLSVSNRSQQHANLEQITVCERLGLLLDMLVAHRDLCERLEKGLAHDHQTALAKMLSLKKRKIQGVIRGTDTESVEQLEAKMLTQENVITNMELRSDFSLYCVHMETQLVYAYLETLSSIFNSNVSLKIRAHSELAEIWKQVMPTVEKFLPVDYGAKNGKS